MKYLYVNGFANGYYIDLEGEYRDIQINHFSLSILTSLERGYPVYFSNKKNDWVSND